MSTSSSAPVIAVATRRLLVASVLSLALLPATAQSQGGVSGIGAPTAIVSHAALKAALVAARKEANGGFNLDMWGTVVDREGRVVAVAFSGASTGDQWTYSRVISAQKASTAVGLGLPGLALSTANLYAPTQPGGSLFGLQESNPVNPAVAYGGAFSSFGTLRDPMVGQRVGGVNVFGGGLPLYDASGALVGAIGVSGDASCADHNIAWKVRDQLKLDFVPGGVSPTKDDNIIYDMDAAGKSAGGFGHPQCAPAATTIGNALPTSHPISKR